MEPPFQTADKIQLVEQIIVFSVCLETVFASCCGVVAVVELYLREGRVVFLEVRLR